MNCKKMILSTLRGEPTDVIPFISSIQDVRRVTHNQAVQQSGTADKSDLANSKGQ